MLTGSKLHRSQNGVVCFRTSQSCSDLSSLVIFQRKRLTKLMPLHSLNFRPSNGATTTGAVRAHWLVLDGFPLTEVPKHHHHQGRRLVGSFQVPRRTHWTIVLRGLATVGGFARRGKLGSQVKTCWMIVGHRHCATERLELKDPSWDMTNENPTGWFPLGRSSPAGSPRPNRTGVFAPGLPA